MVMGVTAEICVTPHMVTMMKAMMAVVIAVVTMVIAVMASRVRWDRRHGRHCKDQGKAGDNRFPTPEKLAHVLFRHATRL